MLFFEKENIFMCLIAFQKIFQKIFFDVWFCSWKYHRKHIFYLLLIFSHIFSVAKRIYNIIHSSKYKQNPEKNHQIQTLRVIAIGASRDRSFAQSRLTLRSIGAVPVISVDDLSELGFGWYRRARLWTISTLSSFFLPLSLFLLLSLSFTRDPEMIWR